MLTRSLGGFKSCKEIAIRDGGWDNASEPRLRTINFDENEDVVLNSMLRDNWKVVESDSEDVAGHTHSGVLASLAASERRSKCLDVELTRYLEGEAEHDGVLLGGLQTQAIRLSRFGQRQLRQSFSTLGRLSLVIEESSTDVMALCNFIHGAACLQSLRLDLRSEDDEGHTLA